MPSHPPIPPLLSSYLDQSPTFLTLLTSTLGSTVNWLVLRVICASLADQRSSGSDDEFGKSQESARETRVVLISWLRDSSFWKDGGRKLGMNFHRVHFIDGLMNGLGLGPDGLAITEKVILKAISDARDISKNDAKVLIILDGLDFLLAAGAHSVQFTLDLIGELRERVDSAVITSCADHALMQFPTTHLEASQVAFLMNLAHQANLIMSLRPLDTGFAKDISGVLRISNGAAIDHLDDSKEDKEYLYYVEADGGVMVFDKGS